MPLANLLPEPVRALANLRGQETAWRRADLERVAHACVEAGFGVLGGQVQFRLPDATCEAWWRNYDPDPRSEGEAWEAFVARSWAEVAQAVAETPDDATLVSEATRDWPLLAAKAAAGADLHSALWFVLYPVSEAEWQALRP